MYDTIVFVEDTNNKVQQKGKKIISRQQSFDKRLHNGSIKYTEKFLKFWSFFVLPEPFGTACNVKSGKKRLEFDKSDFANVGKI